MALEAGDDNASKTIPRPDANSYANGAGAFIVEDEGTVVGRLVDCW